MKHLVLIGDGMADFPLPSHDNRTPLALARTPAMDEVVRLGLTGLFSPIPDGLPPGSDVGNLSVLGYDPHTALTGRAPLEAASQGIVLAPNQIAFRCNLVTLDAGCMRDFTAGHISTQEAASLIDTLNEHLAVGFGVTFHPGVGYRHLTIFTCGDTAQLESLQHVACTPPHDITDQPYASHLPKGPGSDVLVQLMRRSESLFARHPVNAARTSACSPPVTSIWLWGQGRTPAIEPYPSRFGIHGCVISAVDLVNGIGICAGLDPVRVPGATGYLDTNYAGKVAAALQALDRVDFVYLHVEAPDETSHEGRLDLKIRAIEDFDARVVAPCLERARARDDCRVFVAPDHITALSIRTHAGGPVPFALCGPGVQPDAATAYDEHTAAQAGLRVDEAHALLPHILTTPLLRPASLKERFWKCHT